MEKQFLESLTLLITKLEDCGESFWADWMKNSLDQYVKKQDLQKFFRAFGGMGSINDVSFTDKSITSLLSLTYDCAKALGSRV